MIALSGFLLAFVLVMRLAPNSPAARVLHRQLVELPLAWLAKLERPQVIAFVLIGTLFLIGGEVIALLGPELFAAYLVDLSIYLDAIAVSYALATMGRIKGGWQVARARFAARRPRLRTSGRNRRTSRARPLRGLSPPDNDDETAAAWMLAA